MSEPKLNIKGWRFNNTSKPPQKWAYVEHLNCWDASFRYEVEIIEDNGWELVGDWHWEEKLIFGKRVRYGDMEPRGKFDDYRGMKYHIQIEKPPIQIKFTATGVFQKDGVVETFSTWINIVTQENRSSIETRPDDMPKPIPTPEPDDERVKELEEEIEILKQDNKNIKQSNVRLKKELIDYGDKILSLVEKNEVLKDDIKRLEGDIEILTGSITEHMITIERLQLPKPIIETETEEKWKFFKGVFDWDFKGLWERIFK